MTKLPSPAGTMTVTYGIDQKVKVPVYDEQQVREYAAAAVAAEREACAQRVETMGAQGFGTLAIAAAIRLNNKQHEQEKE